MLVEFQQALADLVESPELCRQIRADPTRLQQKYDLSTREYDRLVKMVNQKAMACNCMLYRANRLAPLALNLPDSCRMLGPRLGPLLSEYSLLYPNTNVHFYLECDRFCRFILGKIEQGLDFDSHARAVFDAEHARIKVGLVASYTAL